jgi:hypothetical protein
MISRELVAIAKIAHSDCRVGGGGRSHLGSTSMMSDPVREPSCTLATSTAPELAPVAREDRLFVRHRKRLTREFRINDEGVRELAMYYGLKQVFFDEEHLFPFAEKLGAQPSFLAEEAMGWGPGYTWEELAPLFDTLLAEGVLERGDELPEPPSTGLVPSPLAPSICPVARYWSTSTCPAITADLGGRAIELGYLETVLSVYRVAHPALDGDDRQVGEANTYPAGLRLDRPTEWRTCQYSGSRYRAAGPMNITALRAMIKHWKAVLRTFLIARERVLAICPRSAHGWTVGDLHTLAAVVLTLPAYQLMRGGGQVPQPPVHPVLSSLFRITDGIHMTTHSMMFLSEERTRHPSEVITAADFYGFAERNGLFYSDTGVCAGPKPLIDEFLRAIFDGEASAEVQGLDLPPEVESLLAHLPDVLEYGLLGLQTWAVTRSIWLHMSRAHEALLGLLEPLPGPLARRLHARLIADWERMEGERIAIDYERDVHAQVYVDCYEEPWPAVRTLSGPRRFDEAVAPSSPELVEPARLALLARLTELLDRDGAPAGVAEAAANALVTYLRHEQGVLARAEQIQHAINTLLERPLPSRPLEVRDFRVGHKMQGGDVGRFPYLFDSIEDEWGLAVRCTKDVIEVSGAAQPAPIDAGILIDREAASGAPALRAL